MIVVGQNINIFDNIDMALLSGYRYCALEVSISILEKKTAESQK